MPVKVKLGRKRNLFLWKLMRFVLFVALIMAVIGGAIFGFFYYKYRGLVDDRLAHGPLFASVAQVYAAPQEVRPGQQLSAAQIAALLRRAGYNTNQQLGNYELRGDSILIKPGPQSYLAMDGATITTGSGPGGLPLVISITAENGAPLAAYRLEPQLITALSEDKNRTKRRLVTYDQIPQRMVQAVIAIEDRRFFEHGGINYVRTAKCAIQDTLSQRMECGGSTLTQQLARGFFLSPEKTYSRKLAEIVITFQLESRFDKQQIFEMYANQIPLGQRGSFSIDGFGEAAQAFFGKDVHQLDLAEDALLAGIIQSPSRLNPFRHAERAIERRNLVLDSMVEIGAITKGEAEKAKAEPLHLVPGSVDASEAPYFVDLVHDQLVQKLGDHDFNRESLRIYTSLDPDLQREATAAVESTVHVIDEQVDKLHARDKKLGKSYIYPQVALVALNPHTGQVLALVGGRSYGASQLNHTVAKRPTGSIFKPFVYASAFATAAEGTILPGQTKLFSPLTILKDEQTTYGEGTPYEYTPKNFENEYFGMVTAREALQHSLNNATISLASMVGFERVAQLARDAGIKGVRGTPAMAIGAYDATPLEMAGAYTVFANGGMRLEPWMLASVRTTTGDVIADYSHDSKQILDPRVAYLTTSLMENVIDHGTGAGVRARGFLAPAAGKTGTSHDAWFAGYTTNLLCIVWVGNDDYTDVNIEGAHAAAPIWAEFMKKAVQLPQYSDTNQFTPPEGVDIVSIDKVSSLLSDATCPESFNAAFLAGTAPTENCDHPAEHRSLMQKLFGTGKSDK